MTTLSSERFQELHTRLSYLGQHLLHYTQELRSGQIQEGYHPLGLEQIEQKLANLLEVLKRQTYEVAVIAAMKAGKSTFLNSVIGADVLASATEACTVCRTEIRHLNPGATPYLLEYRVNERNPVLIAEGEADTIRQAFLQRTYEIRQNNIVEEIDYFELHHPIVAINNLQVLSGFTLIDTPGPNEWQTERFNTVHLRQIALEVLRSCQVILFILDYTSFKDSVNQDLLNDLLKNRQNFLQQDQDKLYFLLNKVDHKTESDRPLEAIVSELKQSLQSFGIPDPKVYTSSARQGLLARLIEKGQAKDEHLKDFKKFFAAQYATENEDGDFIIPRPDKIASQALHDSGIPEIEDAVIGTIAQNAGLALLKDVLGQMTIAANEVENLLKVSIQGWSIAVEQLEQKLTEYAAGADRAKQRFEDIQKKIVDQQQELTQKFNQEVDQFGEQASQGIGQEIDALVNRLKTNIRSQDRSPLQALFEMLVGRMSGFSPENEYTVEFSSKEEAQQVYEQINKCCTPIIQEFWIETQDKLSREGDFRRYEVAREIEQEVQVLADELAELLGDVLEFEFRPTQIKIPDYEFLGIDTQIEESRKRMEQQDNQCCQSPRSYIIELFSYTIDFEAVKRNFEKVIRMQKMRIKALIKNVIADQIHADLSTAQNQFTDSFQRIEQELQHIIQQHTDQSPDGQIVELKKQLAILQEYQQEITRIQSELELT